VSAPLKVAVIGARGRLGGFACALLKQVEGVELVADYGRADDWPAAIRTSGAQVALEATHAGLGFEHGSTLLEAGVRPVIATSGVTLEQNAALDALAKELGLGGLVVPNFSVAALLMQRAAAELASYFTHAEIVELHHERKRDAPSATSLETARRIAAARPEPFANESSSAPARGHVASNIPIHSVRLPGLYAHQEILLGRPGELLTLRHDMSTPEAFGPGILLALRFAANAIGVARGLDVALARAT
jgi:4-hydroxy-tetrahydrodipicolinate reductase